MADISSPLPQRRYPLTHTRTFAQESKFNAQRADQDPTLSITPSIMRSFLKAILIVICTAALSIEIFLIAQLASTYLAFIFSLDCHPEVNNRYICTIGTHPYTIEMSSWDTSPVVFLLTESWQFWKWGSYLWICQDHDDQYSKSGCSVQRTSWGSHTKIRVPYEFFDWIPSPSTAFVFGIAVLCDLCLTRLVLASIYPSRQPERRAHEVWRHEWNAQPCIPQETIDTVQRIKRQQQIADAAEAERRAANERVKLWGDEREGLFQEKIRRRFT